MVLTRLRLWFQLFARDGDNLRRDDGHWLLTAKNDGVSGLNILGSMLFNNPKHIPAQEDAAVGCDGIPADRVEVIHPISKNEPEARRSMPISMSFLQIMDG